MEDRMTRNDLLHEKSIRLGNNKRLALDKVCEFPDVGVYTALMAWFLFFSFLTKSKTGPQKTRIAFYEEL